MIKNHTNVALLPVIPMLGAALFAGGCGSAAPLQASSAGDVDQIAMMVRFENHCPKEVIPVVESCDASHSGAGVVCRDHGKRILWVAVAGASLPYQRDVTDFDFSPKNSARNPTEAGKCKKSTAGVLDCKVKADARGYYDYTLVAGGCSLPDPRVYVP